jgi:Ca2+-binding RTX toxin-like protein
MPIFLGSNVADTLFGSASADTLTLLGGDDLGFGSSGNDVLNGGAGNDTLFGGSGADVLIGSLGADQLFGGAGADSFHFFTVSESGVGTGNRDVIEDFERGVDVINLAGVDANATRLGNQAFTFIGGASFTGRAGEMRAEFSDVTDNLVLRMDVNGDGLSDMNIEVANVVSMSVNDFVL